jgi:hypothetical protein
VRIARFVACSALIHAAGAVLLWRSAPRKNVSAPEPTFVEVEVASTAEGSGDPGGRGPGRGAGGASSRFAGGTSGHTNASGRTVSSKPNLHFEHEVDIPVGPSEVPAPTRRGIFQRPLNLKMPLLGDIPPLPEKPRQLTANHGGSTYEDPGERFGARVNRDGTVQLSDQNIRAQGLGFGFDLTDALSKALGHETYLPEKRQLLEESFDRRAILAASTHRERVESALAELPARLEALWSDGRRSARERRQLLFELWDEIDEHDPACRAARMRIIEFIRRRLPEGSPEGYSPGELSALNQGHTIRFEPYRQ